MNGDELHALDQKWAALDGEQAEVAFTRACLMSAYSNLMPRSDLTQHAIESLGISRSEVSRLLHWVELFPVDGAADLASSTKADYAYKLAQKMDAAEAVAFCVANSVSAIRAEHFAAGSSRMSTPDAYHALCVWLADRPGEQIPPRSVPEWEAFGRGEPDAS